MSTSIYKKAMIKKRKEKQSMSDYIDPFMYPVLLACVRRSLYLLYFMAGTILIAKWWYWIQPRIQRYKERRKNRLKSWKK